MARQSFDNGAANAPKQASSPSSSLSAKPKRVRRKCSFPDCSNRVVQGGVCVTHGAKRKLCSLPGCDKAVKLAGFCSTHGPARRKCDAPGCSRVAVQAGKCLSHGARRRVCSYPGGRCEKNAILGGMCKKHYDRVQDAEGMLEMSLCLPVGSSPCLSVGGAAGGGSGRRSSLDGGGQSFDGGNAKVGSGGELSEDGGESYLSSPSSSSAMYGIKPCPSWGSAAPALATVPSADAVPAAGRAAGGGPREGEGALTPSASAPNLAAIGRHHYRRAHGPKAKPSAARSGQGHQRGLSIFDEMPTVDAIINSGGADKSEAAPQSQRPGARRGSAAPPPRPPPPSLPPPRLRQPLAYPPRYPHAAAPALPAIPSQGSDDASMSTKTPTPQVSFADCVKAPRTAAGGAGPLGARAHNPHPCTGNGSCTCDACRSPTLAIFEQMIVASQKLESGDLDLLEYAGLSPPVLRGSPRKHSSAAAAAVHGPTTPGVLKQVSFLPEEPTSTGSVVRKVSSSNIAGEESWESVAARPEEEGRRALRHRFSQGAGIGAAPQDHGGHHPGAQQGPTAPLALADGAEGRRPLQQQQRRQERPASHALAASIALGRTVSHDVDEGQQRYHRVHPPSVHHHRYAPQEQRSYPSHPHQGQSQQQDTSTHPYGPQYHAAPQQAPLPPKYSYHHGGGAMGADPRDYYPPQTPTLYDAPFSSAQQPPLSVVSTHSVASTAAAGTSHHHHRHEHLLPKPRENRAFEHLFIPKEV